MANAADRFFYEGRRAFYNFTQVTTNKRVYFHTIENPYSESSFRGKEWQRGYNAGYFDNLKRHGHK
jgi:hypothetical protein